MKGLRDDRFCEGKSDLFHLIRWVSAVMVVLGHSLMVDKYIFGSREMDQSFRYFATNHHSAVIVFFVLSGYLISYVSRRYNDGSPSNRVYTYFADRWSRIYSVLIPAIGLTLLVDSLIFFFFPVVFQNPTIYPRDLISVRLIANMCSLQGTWGHNIQLGSNPALWSIGYEFSFYLVFGLALAYGKDFYRSVGFWVIAFLFFGFRGPLVFWYMLIWLTGVFSHRLSLLYKIRAGWVLVVIAFALVAVTNHLVVRKQIFGLPFFISDLIFALPVAALLFFDYRDVLPATLKKFNAWMANFSYTLYATHLPVLYLSYCLIDSESTLQAASPALISIGMTCFCVLFAYIFSFVSERRRNAYRNFAKRIYQQFIRRLETT